MTLNNKQATLAQDKTDVNACRLNASCAARHAISLGLHRKSSYAGLSEQEADERCRFFWSIYNHDKSVSLTLGQPSILQDHDIDVEVYRPSPNIAFAPYDRANAAFHRFARIEGMIYNRLYSASALKKSNEERLAIAGELSQTLEDWWHHDFIQEDPDCYGLEFFRVIYIIPAKVTWYSMVSTVHRGTYATSTSPGTLTNACYQAACRAIECHLEALEQTLTFSNGRLIRVYLSWNLLYGTFTPIIVVFLHVISSFDGRDLELLLQFYNSLKDLRDLPEGTARFRNACGIFCSVAKAYVGSRDILPSTAAVPAEAIIRREDVQQAFDASQMSGYAMANTDTAMNWEQFDPSNLDGMYNFVDNWMDGTQQTMDFLNMDLGPF